ncbi:MAG: MFS transporter [Gemmiger sp.]|nr:MFS transporter [Gemmiger sp.]
MGLKQLFYPEVPPTPAECKGSQRILLLQGALAAVMYTLVTGNFMAGYLDYLGATPAQIAQIAAIPQLGCVLQLVSPLFFEKRVHRKLSIVCLCFGFRFALGFTVLAPLLFHTQESQLRFAFALYLVSFLVAGFVTPALNQWVLQIAPEEGRGRYFAIKDILAAVANASIAYLMGRCLDGPTAAGTPFQGFLWVYGFCIAGSLVDLVLMCLEKEPPCPAPTTLRVRDLALPLRDKHYRPLLVYEILCYCSFMASMGFLSVYQLNVLHLTHTFITSVGVLTSAAGMAAIWVWGRVADHAYWTTVILATRALATLCLFGWCFLPGAAARPGAVGLLLLTAVGSGAAGMAGMNLQYANCPPQRRTTYLGVTAAVASLAGYGCALLGSSLQRVLQPAWGARGSMAALFGISGVLSLLALAYGWARLPRRPGNGSTDDTGSTANTAGTANTGDTD